MLSVWLLGVALAVDAAVVSAGIGAAQRSVRPVVAAAVLFGLFQAGMALAGAVGGAWLAGWASQWDHWVAFALLVGVGGRMLIGTGDDEGEAPDVGPVALLALAVATSIDALAAGVSLPLLGPLAPAAAIIGGVTTVLSLGAGAAGWQLGTRLGPTVERIGGVVLIGIGARILVEHLGGWA